MKFYAKDKNFNGVEEGVQFKNGFAEVPETETAKIANLKLRGYTLEAPKAPAPAPVQAPAKEPWKPTENVKPASPLEPKQP